MSRALGKLALLLALMCGATSVARAQDLKDRFNFKLSLASELVREQQLGSPTLPTGVDANQASVAGPLQIFYGDLRLVMDGRRLPGSFELHFDGRIRLTGNFDTTSADFGDSQTGARGYTNGREYDLRSFWVKHKGEKVDFAFGRLIVAEADATRLDGVRLWWRVSKHWDLSLYAGGYPDPYSRSIFDDYRVAHNYATDFAFAGGADATYTYDKIWGSFSVSGAYFHGTNDGGPLDANKLNPTTMPTPPYAAGSPGTFATETPRVWITWTDFVRIFSWLDLFTDLVVDATGSAGAQLTRLDALLTIRAGKHLTLHLGYDHLSPLAIEMWLSRLLYDRNLHTANTIENNLIVERTARDEARAQVDLSFGKFSVYGEGRFRRRAIVNLTDDPQFVAAGNQVAPGVAYDATLGLRDRGTLAGLRLGLWASFISDYRARNFIANFDFGRSWFDERLSFDLSFLYAKTNDTSSGAGMMGLPVACQPFPYGAGAAMGQLGANATCYGTRDGSEYELGLTVAGEPFAHWYAFVDYRLVADTTSGNLTAGNPTATPPVPPLPQPTILTHVLMLLIEARY